MLGIRVWHHLDNVHRLKSLVVFSTEGVGALGPLKAHAFHQWDESLGFRISSDSIQCLYQGYGDREIDDLAEEFGFEGSV